MVLSKEDYKKSYIEKYNKKNDNYFSKKIFSEQFTIKFLFISIPLVFTLFLDLLFFEDKKINSEILKNNNDYYFMKKLDSIKKIENINYDNLKISLLNFNSYSNKPNKPNEIIKVKIKPKPLRNFIFTIPEDIGEKKIHFIKTVLPKVLDYNKQILAQRQRLNEINNNLISNRTLSKNDQKYLKSLAKKYNVEFKNKHKIDIINKLLFKIDIIPNSIVIAQAANESGWGTSRFAQDYNAYFGEYTYDSETGVVPLKRGSNEKHLVKLFSSLDKSVESYFNNINSHYAYEGFRKERYKQRQNSIRFDVKLLINQLYNYAEDKNYTNSLNLIIKTNKLKSLDIIPSI